MKPLMHLLIAAHLLLPVMAAAEDRADPYAAARQTMVETIRHDAAALRRALGEEPFDAHVLAALGQVPRHEFVPENLREAAYENRPLPIGYGQTISQPTVVAYMTSQLKLKPGARVLEVGTGSGYQAAVLAQLGVRVFSIEIIVPLGEAARERLRRLKYDQVETRIGDGYYGWKEAAPFDGMIVTAATNHIPPPLLEQLKPGGRLVIPLGNPFGMQHLVVAHKDAAGRVTTQKLLPVQFVPLTGRQNK
jgi:protein-L-isoaspartate(D-aspartate) O-methyltransferase